MKNELYQYLAMQGGNLSAEEILLSFVAALVIGAIIYVSYRFSHASSVYSAKFNVSLFMLVLVTTMIMSVIGNNVALSLGMVGALSIVRFRTAIKDARDTAYIFWAIAAGICCGVGDYLVAAVGTGVIFIMMLFMGNVRNNDRYLLVVRGEHGLEEAEVEIQRYFADKAQFRVSNEDKQSVELIYEVTARDISKAKKKWQERTIQKTLLDMEKVDTVNLICQNDEITR